MAFLLISSVVVYIGRLSMQGYHLIFRPEKYGFLLKGFNLSCHNQETTLFIIVDPYYGSLN